MYRPKISRDTMREHALKQLLDGFFDGSAEGYCATCASRTGAAR